MIAAIIGPQIYPAPWNVVKAAYLFCRYYPLAIAPFLLWSLLGDHNERICESYYHALYACTIPTVRPIPPCPIFPHNLIIGVLCAM